MNEAIYSDRRGALLREALLDSLPILSTYFPLGIVWGVLWEQAGFPAPWGILYSLFSYSGAVQFIALPVLITGGSLAGLIATAVPMALRNSFYTTAMLPKLPQGTLLRLYLTFGLVDIPFVILNNKPEQIATDTRYMLPLCMSSHLYWVSGTACGIFGGSFIPNEFTWLNFVLPTLIALLIFGQLKKPGHQLLSAVAAAVACFCWLIFSGGWLLPALCICAAISVLPIQLQGDS